MPLLESKLFNGLPPWTMRDKVADHETPACRSITVIEYPKYDGVSQFLQGASLPVFMSNTNHEEDQPLVIRFSLIRIYPLGKNLALYDEPAQRYCPAGVYEVVSSER